MDDYLSIKELCEKLKITRQTLHRWIKEGKVKSIKVGGTIRIPTSQFKNMEGK